MIYHRREGDTIFWQMGSRPRDAAVWQATPTTYVGSLAQAGRIRGLPWNDHRPATKKIRRYAARRHRS